MLRVSSAAWPVLIALERARFYSRRSLSRKELPQVPHTITSLIRESWRLSNSHSELTFFNLVKKNMKVLTLLSLYVQNMWRRMVMFFLRLQYSKNLWSTGANFISSSESKIKVLMFPLFFDISLAIFSCRIQIKIKVFEPNFPAMRYIAVRKLEEVLACPWFTEI